MSMKSLVPLTLTASLLFGCSSDSTQTVSREPSTTPTSTESSLPIDPVNLTPPDPVQEYMDGMSLEQKVGQLFIVRPEAFTDESTSVDINSSDTEGFLSFDENSVSLLEQIPVGGIALFGKNIQDPDQLASFMEQLHNTPGVPLFLSVDEEGGLVARIGRNDAFDVKTYSSMYDVGSTNDPNAAYEVGSTIGTYLKEYGFNVDFAPDADVFTNPDNTVIGHRAFSSDPTVAATMVSQAVYGFHSAGMLCTLKHFPGHGDTETDSHLGYAESDQSWDEMLNCEMLPFKAGMEAGADFIMAAHITTPNATSDGLPATLSHEMLTDKLRGELGYTGIIITDALDMEAITNYYSSAEASVMSFNAGTDILLMPHNLSEAYHGVLDAVKDGTITEDRLNESVYRILSTKFSYGIIQ